MIPLVDLSLDKELKNSIKKRLSSVIESKNFILGNEVKAFERKFARFIGTKYAIGVGSGTDGLRLALRSLRIGRDDKVLTTAFTSPFTSVAIVEEGAIPVYCDIDKETLTISIKEIESRIDKMTKAIMPVHILGNPCDMVNIIKIAKRYKLKVIEDACQAHGAMIVNKKIGSFGDCAAFSFYPTKNLGALGDGGIVVTNNLQLAKMIGSLRHGGQTKRFWHEFKGVNSRLDEIQAAILSEKLKYITKFNKKRETLTKRYRKKLSDLPIKFQESFSGAKSAFHQFVIRTKKRSALKNYLYTKGILTDIYYPYAVDRQPAFRIYSNNHLKITSVVTNEILALPLYPHLSLHDQDLVISSIREFFTKNK